MKPPFLTLTILLLAFFPAFGQSNFRVMFYNVENLFDTFNNPEKNDDDFLPDGAMRWTLGRYRNKLNNIAKVISSAGEWETPALVGLCEIESDTVMKALTLYSPLKKMSYRYVITDSPDLRGVNVAMLYQRDKFKYIEHQSYRILFPHNRNKKTRDILHVTGQVSLKDTMDVFVCHFPSRVGGETQSELERLYVASVLRAKSDSLMKIRKNACILIMGDFNDEPSNRSISHILQAEPVSIDINPHNLYNLFTPFEKRKNMGSYKFQGQWNLLDQIIVSGNMITGSSSIKVLPQTATIFSRDFMLVNDKTWGGKRPKPTYYGRKYEGGYSDHLPVLVDFVILNR